jgi:hypothetical protein|tara:strand:+ start:236 stop:442 length:207 start_codon:yes stop_codon:yes gene_type:complete
MTKKLTIKQIDKRIKDIEHSYYKGWKMNEHEWRFSGVVRQTDLMQWGKLHKMRRRLENEQAKNKKQYS